MVYFFELLTFSYWATVTLVVRGGVGGGGF